MRKANVRLRNRGIFESADVSVCNFCASGVEFREISAPVLLRRWEIGNAIW